MKFKRRIAATLTTAVLAAGMLTAGAGSAQAATITFKTSAGGGPNGKNFQIAALRDGKNVGYTYWNGDPIPELNWPGDAMMVSDIDGDGWGIEATLAPIARVATTRGHNAPYDSPWATGNLDEGDTLRLKVCLVRGDAYTCSKYYSVKA
ncbi:hypothetical protein [Streptomyces sp. NPDC127033]|uniref:hypothetical protein n=1 Tax=Streptomyces sp. NPDC127033 TaxID=3347110 RepID=UPI00365D70A9